jgi:hypothetical protein
MSTQQKQIILAGKIVLFALLTWFFLHQLLYVGLSTTFLILAVVGLLFWGISICLGSLFIDKKATLYLAFTLSLLSFFVFFRGGEMIPGQFREAFYYFIVLVLIFLALIFYRKRVKHEKETRTKLNFWRILKRGLSLTFTLVCLLIALAYYFSPSLGGISKIEFEIPRNLFDTVLKPLSGLVQTRLPLYRPDMSIDELLTMFSITVDEEGLSGLSFEPSPELYRIIQSKNISIETLDVNQLLKDPEIAKLLQEEIKKKTSSLSLNQLAQQRAEFSEKLGIEIEGNETLNDVLYKLVNAQINAAGGPYEKYIPIALAVGLFFFLRILTIILIPIIVLFSIFIIKILIAVGFAKINIKPMEAEEIEI